jgi:hypothetical protein
MNEAGSGPSPAGVRRVWATDPERIDPDDHPAQQPFARLMTCAPCPSCHLQVHTLYTRFLLQGIDCPGCGAQLLPPPPNGSEQLARAMREEDLLSQELESNAY